VFDELEVGRMLRGKLVTRVGVVSAMLMATLGGASVARAQTTTEEGDHCVAFLEPVDYDAATDTVTAEIVDGGCYATFSEALDAGSGGSIDVAASTSPADLTASMVASLDPSGPSADTLIGTEYDDTLFAGASRSYFAATGCGQATYEVNVADNWNNRFESGEGFHNCDHNRKFQFQNQNGDSVLCTPDCSSYGALRNNVSSLRWKNGA
jgi:hypothetical protein